MNKTENPRKSLLKLIYNGVDAAAEFSSKTESFTYTDVASGEADTLSLTVNNQDGRWLNGFMPEDGDYVEAKIAVENWNKQGDNRNLFCGMFDLDSFKAVGFPETCSIKGITIPICTGFHTTVKTHTFSNTTTKTILSNICRDAGITLVYESEDYTVQELEQDGKTDMEFAFSLCKTHNLAMKLYNKKMVVYNQTDYENKKASYTIDRSEMQNYSYTKEKSKAYDSVQIQYTDPNRDETLSYRYTLPGSNGSRTLFLNEQVASYQEAEIRAKARLLENLRKAVNISFGVRGDTKYIAAQTIRIKGLGKASGIYFIDRVTHSKSAGGAYTCTIKAHLCITNTGGSELKPKNQNEELQGTKYIVKKGDCLWKLAERFYGDGEKYKIIYNANKEQIEEAHWIYPGQVFIIPPT